jgi:hypothetical protein
MVPGFGFVTDCTDRFIHIFMSVHEMLPNKTPEPTGVGACRSAIPKIVCTKSRLTSRRSQPPLALAVPLSRFTSRVGGGSAFFVRLQA